MTRMRLTRMGAKKQPFYRVVIADQKGARNEFITEVGTYNPLNGGKIEFNVEKTKEWLAKGAQPTDTVKVLLKKAGVTD